jgi:drug/metabolite transporter (DMT)-like permease
MTVTGGRFSSLSISWIALFMGIMSGFTYALLPILSRTGADRENPYTAAFYGQLFGAMLLLMIIRPWNTDVVFNTALVLAILGLGIVPSAMAYIAYYGGLSQMKETSKVPVLASVETVVAALIGLVAFGEELGIAKIIGIALVLVSIVVMNLGAKDWEK